MSSDRNSPPTGYPSDRRRSSFSAGQIAEMFNGRSASISGASSAGQGPITQAAAAAHRRLSVTTMGLSGSPTQTSPFSPSGRPRAESISSGSNNSEAIDESPFEDDNTPLSSIPSASFGRRLSFGARAMRDMRAPSSASGSSGNGNGNHRPSVSGGRKPSSPHPPTAAASKPGRGSGSGIDLAQSFRSRAERASISAPSGPSQSPFHQRAKSISAMEQPAREMPKPRVPDAIQERMLRGDFYMD